jgi:hypothetical protein
MPANGFDADTDAASYQRTERSKRPFEGPLNNPSTPTSPLSCSSNDSPVSPLPPHQQSGY